MNFDLGHKQTQQDDSGLAISLETPSPLISVENLPLEHPGNWLLMLDVDGTLLEIAHRPDAVVVPHSLKASLLKLYEITGGAVFLISGRSIQELDTLFAPLKLPAVGLHGAEWRTNGKIHRLKREPLAETLQQLLSQAESLVRKYPGTLLEQKQYSIAIHYRRRPQLAEELRKEMQHMANIAGPVWRLLPGKMVYEITPSGVDKASALKKILEMSSFRMRKPVFVGDDVTDAAALAYVRDQKGYAVKVGEPSVEGMIYAPHPEQIRSWLRQLADQANDGLVTTPLRKSVRISTLTQGGRIIVVSNRVAAGRAKASTGGLAVAMSAVLNKHGGMWIGWSGKIGENFTSQKQGNVSYLLQDLSQEEHDRFYTQFCNAALWPLLHYNVGLSDFSREAYEAYLQVNERFADIIAAEIQPSDYLWVHDFHFIPLAHMLRQRGITNRIGFFLHTPYPSKEVLLTLPVHKELMSMLYAYNVVGFQTQHDLEVFRDYSLSENIKQHAQYPAEPSTIVGHFPIGIETDSFAALSRKSLRSTQAMDLKESLSGRQLILGVDRLDYSKGITHRLKAMEELLDKQPHWKKKFTFLQIAPPTRENIDHYAQLRAEVESLVGHINGIHTEVDWVPIRFLVRGIGREVISSFYRLARVCLVTPLRDGMNLVAKEFIAAQDPEDPGVLILSRFAGAAEELSQALLINPYDTQDMAVALDKALSMPLEERKDRWNAMYNTISKQNLEKWYQDYLDALLE